MLSTKDKKWLENIIEQKITNALTVEVQYECFNKEKGFMERKCQNEYLPVWWVKYLPDFMGALRGMQEDTNKANNKMISTTEGINGIADILINMEKGVKTFIEMANMFQNSIELIERKKIEGNFERR